VPILALIGSSHRCVCISFQYDSFGDHLQTSQVKSSASQSHDWVVYRLGGISGSVVHKGKIHKITPATGKEKGDLERKDYVVLSSHVRATGQLTNTRRSDGAPEPDGALRVVTRKKILHDRQLYINRPDPITFLPVAVDTTGRIYYDLSRLLFLHTNRESSALSNEIPEESFRPFISIPCFIRSRRPQDLT
jgi:hypothetical protein